MKISTGVLMGVVAGLVIGTLTGVVSYLGVLAIEEEFKQFIRKSVIEAGATPDVAEQVVAFTMQWLPVSTIGGAIIFGVLFYLVLGVVMAVLWEKLKMPWYGKGAVFAVVILAVNAALSAAFTFPGAPTPPLFYEVASVALTFIGPIFLAWLLHKREASA